LNKEYILKHRNIPVLLFEMDDEKYSINRINKIFETERLPFNGFNPENNIDCALQLDKWISGRGLAQSRKDLDKIKELFNVSDTKSLTVKSYGLNLTDHYWLHETDENLNWEKVNYFDNSFDKVIPARNIVPEINDSVDNKSPNVCVDGSIEKRWVILEDERVLLKGSRYKRMQEPFNERIASMIMDLYNIPHVNYNVKRTADNIPYSECRCMVNKDTEFINTAFIMKIEDYWGKDPCKHFLDICQRNGVNDIKDRLDEMFSIDFLIGNADRHWGNFGIIRNANNLKWICAAPVFDNGNSLFFDYGDDELQYAGVDSLGKAFGDSNRLNLEQILYPEWYKKNISNNIIHIVNQCLHYNERLSESRIEKLTDITRQRLEIFEKKISEKTVRTGSHR
jgi:hypothetical protein